MMEAITGSQDIVDIVDIVYIEYIYIISRMEITIAKTSD